MEKIIKHWCEACGVTAMLTSEKAYQAGWDFPPRIGEWGVISPRTCGKCPINSTLWWAIQSGELNQGDPLAWPEARRRTLARILDENIADGVTVTP